MKDTEYTYGLLGNDVELADGSVIYLPGRADEVLKRMQELGYATKAERAEAEQQLKDYEFSKYVANQSLSFCNVRKTNLGR